MVDSFIRYGLRSRVTPPIDVVNLIWRNGRGHHLAGTPRLPPEPHACRREWQVRLRGVMPAHAMLTGGRIKRGRVPAAALVPLVISGAAGRILSAGACRSHGGPTMLRQGARP